LARQIDVPFDEGLINETISRFTFDKLSGGRPQGTADNMHFYRKGVIGDYRNHFDMIDRALFYLNVPTNLRRLYIAIGESAP
jgi:hypothetical protein